MEATIAIGTALAESGIEPQRTWLAEGHFEAEADEVRWVRDHRDLLALSARRAAARPAPRAAPPGR